jgi:hypothetical protein
MGPLLAIALAAGYPMQKLRPLTWVVDYDLNLILFPAPP